MKREYDEVGWHYLKIQEEIPINILSSEKATEVYLTINGIDLNKNFVRFFVALLNWPEGYYGESKPDLGIRYAVHTLAIKNLVQYRNVGKFHFTKKARQYIYKKTKKDKK